MLAGIKNIIFDLGGVLYNLNYQLTIDAFNRLGGGNFAEIYSQQRQRDLFDRLEKGEISVPAFCDELRLLTGWEMTNDQIAHAWNAMLLGIPPHRVQLLEKIRSRYRLFLLSNTNEIHLAAVTRHLEETFGYGRFSAIFENLYYSHRVGMRKPDCEIFEYVLAENRLVASETLFIDDSVQHVEGAKKTGLNAFLLEPGKEIGELFPEP